MILMPLNFKFQCVFSFFLRNKKVKCGVKFLSFLCFSDSTNAFLCEQVQVLGRLQHPHLLNLLGVCTEAWSIVYEYLPNGTLQDYLFRRSNNSPLTWKIRARMIAEIASALCFLHSSKPETIIHGDLKPETILLDSSLSCKICEFGFSRLVTEESLYRPSFQFSSEMKSAHSYTDPQFQRTGVLTPKSDIYSFGLIILQLLTGRTPVGLAVLVRNAVSCGNLSSILDSSAGEWPLAVATRLVELGLQCCQQNRRDRPELTPTLVRELEQLHVSEERPVPSFFLCPILQVTNSFLLMKKHDCSILPPSKS